MSERKFTIKAASEPQAPNSKPAFNMSCAPLKDGGISFELSDISEGFMELVSADAQQNDISVEEYFQRLFVEAITSGSLTIKGWELPKDEPQRPTIPYSPNPFSEGEAATVPNNPFTHFFMSTVFNGGPLAKLKGWEESIADRSPKYEKENVGSPGALWRRFREVLEKFRVGAG